MVYIFLFHIEFEIRARQNNNKAMFGYYIMLLIFPPFIISYYPMFNVCAALDILLTFVAVIMRIILTQNMCTAWEINNWSMIGLLCSKWVWRLGKDCKNGSDCIISHWGWPQLRGCQYNKQPFFTFIQWRSHMVLWQMILASMCSIEASYTTGQTLLSILHLCDLPIILFHKQVILLLLQFVLVYSHP